MTILLFIIAGFMLLSIFTTIASVGKPREPYTPGVVAFATLINLAVIVIIVIAALHYHSA